MYEIHRYSKEEVREALLQLLKAVATYYVLPSDKAYNNYQDASQNLDDILYTINDDWKFETVDDEDEVDEITEQSTNDSPPMPPVGA